MQRRSTKPRKLSAFDNLLLACDNANFFLTPNRQSYASFNGTAAPLYSEQFRGWLFSCAEQTGLATPSASMLGHLRRHHDNLLHTYQSEIIPIQSG